MLLTILFVVSILFCVVMGGVFVIDLIMGLFTIGKKRWKQRTWPYVW